MIILSVGMPRAGSGWYYNLTNDLMCAVGAQDARQIRERYHLQDILTAVNCNIGALTPRRLGAVLLPSLLGNTFVIKAHAGPTPFAKLLIRAGALRPAYIYRDPRDAMLSAMENGARARQRGANNAFSHLVDFETALRFMGEYVRIWEAWMGCEAALHTRYESLLDDYDAEIERLMNFLKLGKEKQALQETIEKYRPQSIDREQKGLHFSKGRTGRFREKFSAEEQQWLLDAFGQTLEKMGYES